jgi:hypothetical protein
MTPNQLRTRISRLPSSAPFTEAFDASLARLGQHHRKKWWDNHKTHWLGWTKNYDPSRTAEYVYNHINCPPMLTWLAEASGINSRQVSAAVAAALRADDPWPAKCGAIRRLIPWQEIEMRLE